MLGLEVSELGLLLIFGRETFEEGAEMGFRGTQLDQLRPPQLGQLVVATVAAGIFDGKTDLVGTPVLPLTLPETFTAGVGLTHLDERATDVADVLLASFGVAIPADVHGSS
jgi:hypothetical protein